MTRVELQRFVAKTMGLGLSASTVRNTLIPVRAIYRLMDALRDYVKVAGLYNNKRRIFAALRPFEQDLFWKQEHWEEFKAVALRYLQSDLSKLDKRRLDGLAGVGPLDREEPRRSSGCSRPTTGRARSSTARNGSTRPRPSSATAGRRVVDGRVI